MKNIEELQKSRLKEEFRIPIKMTQLAVDELNKFFYLKGL